MLSCLLSSLSLSALLLVFGCLWFCFVLVSVFVLSFVIGGGGGSLWRLSRSLVVVISSRWAVLFLLFLSIVWRCALSCLCAFGFGGVVVLSVFVCCFFSYMVYILYYLIILRLGAALWCAVCLLCAVRVLCCAVVCLLCRASAVRPFCCLWGCFL